MTITSNAAKGKRHPCHDHDSLLRRVGGDQEVLRELLVLFREDIATRLASLDEGLAKKDTAAIAAVAHSVRGMVLLFSAARAADLAGVIETKARARDVDGLSDVVRELHDEVKALVAELTESILVPAGAGGGL